MFKKLKKEVNDRIGSSESRKKKKNGKGLADDLANMHIPKDPEEFYADFGYLVHPDTKEPVIRLAPYQIVVWKSSQQCKRVLVIKANKIGLTTSTLIADFHLAVLPSSDPVSCRGNDQLIIAQNTRHALEHIRTLYNMILSSPKYRTWLITKPSKNALKGDATKASVIYIRNPDNENQPSRIIAMGINNPGNMVSWKNVKHIHISDPTATTHDYSEAIDNAITRLANSNGSVIIETVPGAPQGMVYDLYRQSKIAGNTSMDAFENNDHVNNDGSNCNRIDKDNGNYDKEQKTTGGFKLFEIPASEAVKYGIIRQDFLDGEKERLGNLFQQYYEAKFITLIGGIFSPGLVDFCTQDYSLASEAGSSRIMGVDWGFGSSRTALIGIERRSDGKLYVIESREMERPTISQVEELIASIYHEYKYSQCFADGSQPGIIKDLTEGSQVVNRLPIDIQAVEFGKELSEMLQRTIRVIREAGIVIHPEHVALIEQLKTVQYNDKGNPDKSIHSLDLLDALMMAVSHVQSGELYFDDLGNIHDNFGIQAPSRTGNRDKTPSIDIDGNGDAANSNQHDDINVSTNNNVSQSKAGGIGFVTSCEKCGKPVVLDPESVAAMGDIWTRIVYCSDCE